MRVLLGRSCPYFITYSMLLYHPLSPLPVNHILDHGGKSHFLSRRCSLWNEWQDSIGTFLCQHSGPYEDWGLACASGSKEESLRCRSTWDGAAVVIWLKALPMTDARPMVTLL